MSIWKNPKPLEKPTNNKRNKVGSGSGTHLVTGGSMGIIASFNGSDVGETENGPEEFPEELNQHGSKSIISGPEKMTEKEKKDLKRTANKKNSLVLERAAGLFGLLESYDAEWNCLEDEFTRLSSELIQIDLNKLQEDLQIDKPVPVILPENVGLKTIIHELTAESEKLLEAIDETKAAIHKISETKKTAALLNEQIQMLYKDATMKFWKKCDWHSDQS